MIFNNTRWTKAREDELRDLYSQGLSSSQIARAMGGLSRNAVIGKVHRMGLNPKGGGRKDRVSIPVTMPSPELKSVVATKQTAPAPIPKSLPIDSAEPIGIMELDETTCKWPIDDEEAPTVRYCGRPTNGKPPYCEGHSKKAFESPNARRYAKRRK